MRFSVLPNVLTVLRLALVPVIVVAILRDRYALALAVFAVAGASDGLDGFLARRLHAESRFGAYLDPISDKAIVSTIYISLAWVEAVPWWLVLLVFGRDLLILAGTGLVVAFTKVRDFPPSVWGKLATFIHLVTLVLVMLSRASDLSWAGELTRIAIWAAAAATVWSGLVYVSRGYRMVRD
ncbi:MAG: CDP-alcohol phosphatidyltransferase family protein [bacterium]|nr:CDP-alcohol phosphatidyltransferase family protein [bacterium]